MVELDYMEMVDELAELDAKIVEDPVEVGAIFTGKNKLNILHMNIRSLQKNFDELVIYLNMINLNNIDVMIFSETFILENVNNFQLQGFKILYNESLLNKNDGLVIYLRENFTVKHSLFQLNETNILRCEIELDDNTSFGITACYRSPSGKLDTFLGELEDLLSEIKPTGVDIFVGDVNINLLDINDKQVNKYLNIMSQNAYFSCINKPTRETELSATLIDHLFIKVKDFHEQNNTITPFVLHSALTDHYTIGLSIQKEKNLKHDNDNFRQRLDLNQLKKILSKEDWSGVYQSECVGRAYGFFIERLKSYILQSTQTIRLNNKNRKRKLWITEGIMASIKKRDQLKKSLNVNYSVELLNEYKHFRNTLNKIIKLAKNNYLRNKIVESKNNYKKIWETINETTRTRKRNKQQIKKIIHNNEVIHDEQKMTNTFNEFFISIGSDLQNNIVQHNNQRHTAYINPHSIFLRPVNENELIQHINTLKDNSSPGDDGIRAEVIKNIHIYILKPLEYMINLCLITSKIPQEWKTSIVTPIFKDGDPTLLTNYRPISIINNFNKIFEKCLKDRIVEYLEKDNHFYENQFGFRKNRSTEDAVFTLIRNINENLQRKQKSLAIFLDLKKAFDTVPHNILLDRLERMGIRDGPLELIRDYLTNRTQKTKINNSFSTHKTITTGIPQGTVLGPILFLIYINNIGSLIRNCKVISYADDTVLLFDGRSWEEVYGRAEVGIGIMQEWLSGSLLSLNISKSYFMTFSATSSDQPDIFEICIHEENCTKPDCCCSTFIKKCAMIKYLGVIIDQNLKWNCHTAYLCTRMRKVFYKLYQLRDVLNKRLIIIVYKSLIESILKYCITMWGSAYDNALYNLQVCQNSALKIIFRKPRMFPTIELYSGSGLFNLRNLYVNSSLSYFLKIMQLFPVISHGHSTRSNLNENLQLPLFHSNVCQRFLTFLIPKIFNILPLNIRRLIHRQRRFKTEVKNFIAENPQYFAQLFT